MGIEAENIMRSFGLEGTDSKSFDTVLGKFNDQFIPQKNIIHKRAKFHQRKQRPDENAEQFIRALYESAANCDFKRKQIYSNSGCHCNWHQRQGSVREDATERRFNA